MCTREHGTHALKSMAAVAAGPSGATCTPTGGFTAARMGVWVPAMR